MMRKGRLAIFLLFISLGPLARAEVIFEPFFGYLVIGQSELKDDQISHTTYQHSFSGLNYGARLGFHSMGIMAGAQYDHSGVGFNQDKPANGSSTDVSINNWSFFVGFQSPLGVRVYGNFFFNSVLSGNGPGEAANRGTLGKDDTDTGSGFGLGVGWKVLALPIAVNVEYRVFTYREYDRYNVDGVQTAEKKNFTTEYGADRGASQILLNVSFPLTFL